MAIVSPSRTHSNFMEEGMNYINFDKVGRLFFDRNRYTARSQEIKMEERMLDFKAKAKDLFIDINGKSFRFPYVLKRVMEQIEEAEEILQYPFDWDEEGALPTDIDTFEMAALFVKDYALNVFNCYNLILPLPFIDILKDGSISVHWETEGAQLLIIFKKGNQELAYYYAEQKSSKVPLKSAIEPGESVDEFLALWMKKNLI